MPEAAIIDRKSAIESRHGDTTTFKLAAPVTETHGGNIVRQSVVHVFVLAGQPKAARAYAGSSPIEDSSKRRVFAVLRMGVS